MVLTKADQRTIKMGDQCVYQLVALKKSSNGRPLNRLEKVCLTNCKKEHCVTIASINYQKPPRYKFT